MSRWRHSLILGSLLCLACLLGLLLLPGPRERRPSQLTACKANLQQISEGLERFAREHQGHYPAEIGELVPRYLAEIPCCPAAGHDTYSISYRSCSAPDNYVFFCSGHNHQQTGLGPNLPACSRERGILLETPRGRHHLTQCQSRLETLMLAVESYRRQHKQLPVRLSQLSPNLSALIGDVRYQPRENGAFRLACPGLSHAYEGLQPGEPAVDSSASPALARGEQGEAYTTTLPTGAGSGEDGSHSPAPADDLTPPAPSFDDGSASLNLGLLAFFFILFVLWPFETPVRSEIDNGWKLLAPSRRKG